MHVRPIEKCQPFLLNPDIAPVLRFMHDQPMSHARDLHGGARFTTRVANAMEDLHFLSQKQIAAIEGIIKKSDGSSRRAGGLSRRSSKITIGSTADTAINGTEANIRWCMSAPA